MFFLKMLIRHFKLFSTNKSLHNRRIGIKHLPRRTELIAIGNYAINSTEEYNEARKSELVLREGEFQNINTDTSNSLAYNE